MQMELAHVGNVDGRACSGCRCILGAWSRAIEVAIWILPCAPGLQLAATQ